MICYIANDRHSEGKIGSFIREINVFTGKITIVEIQLRLSHRLRPISGLRHATEVLPIFVFAGGFVVKDKIRVYDFATDIKFVFVSEGDISIKKFSINLTFRF